MRIIKHLHIQSLSKEAHLIKNFLGMTDIIKSAQAWKPGFTEWFVKSVPDFTIIDITGEQHKISDYKGQTDLVKEFAEKEKVNYTILVSEGTLVPPYNEINAIPTTFIIDPKGNIKIATVGTLSLNDLNNLLKAQ